VATADQQLSTGVCGLDRVLKGLLPGDNVVWQIGSIDEYVPFVRPYYERAVAQGRKVVYFRFAKHEPLVPEGAEGVQIQLVHPEEGFETFIDEIHGTIEQTGRGAFYIFDCLSDLAVDWYSDRMLGNFFMLTCPYLYDLETITYFALLRDYHSLHATTPISETTQLFLDVYRHNGKIYLHPLKVQHRYGPTMHMLHVWEGDSFLPVTESHTTSDVLASAMRSPLESASSRLGMWYRTFLQAEQTQAAVQKGCGDPAQARALFQRMLRMIVSRDARMLGLAEKHLALDGLLDVCKRMIGTGLIGGKSVGMLLARAILEKSPDGASKPWRDLLEVHDSFFIGSDVFYTYLVRNGVWWVRQKQKNPQTFLEGSETGRQRILSGSFPDYIERQFEEMLDYFGQSPIIVRSSSLLEDNFGNAFAGKYDSVFCANQGSRHKRLEDFISAVRTIYASTMSERALTYRARRNLLHCDEQMALLVQRVSGGIHGSYFYPHVAGVAFSFNPYVWSEYIDPEAGMLRLVFGLGTRAVDRSDDDYTRLVALNAPERRPESDYEKVRQHTQRKVDTIDLEGNLLTATDFASAAAEAAAGATPNLPLNLFASRDEAAEQFARERGTRPAFPWMLTFDELLSNTPFVEDMRRMLRLLHEAYDYPVDVEFTANFVNNTDYRFNLVQCRPLQVRGNAADFAAVSAPPEHIKNENILFRSSGAVIGQSRVDTITRLIYVVPETYSQLPVRDRYTVARLIGQAAHAIEPQKPETIMLMGPGRWGTTTPSLGVPVSFAEINTVSVICEIVAMREDLIPDVSLGTHFFSDLVEMDILYLALFPNREGNSLNQKFFDKAPNRLLELVPRASTYAHVIKVIDRPREHDWRVIKLNANTLNQKAVCYLDHGDKGI